ncbi:MAG TPA: GWxTD domain-containing protein [Bacteroidales bacterium]|nr:GWxTD domain-containing protein [Bacteroidales bacterium]
MFRYRKFNFITTAGILLVITIMFSCTVSQQATDSKDLSYIYNPIRNPIAPLYDITSLTDSVATFSVKFNSSDLFFTEANPRGVPMSLMLVSVKLYNVTNEAIIADTAAMNLSIVQETSKNEYVYSTKLNVQPGSKYIADVKILDKIRSSVVQSFIPYNTVSELNKYNFQALDHLGKNKLFAPIVRKDEYVNLVYNEGPADSLYISYYRPFTPIPEPPSMLLPEKSLDYDPDTIITIPYSPGQPLMFPQKGIYLCSVDKDTKDGYTFLNLGDEYPGISKPESMIDPLAYLANEEELRTMKSSQKPKVAVDDFWIKIGGNVDKSRELIRIYYTRVLYSNYYFTSYKEGWRTERGMIYIIYGPPDKVYKSAEGESWGYRRPGVSSSWGSRFSVKRDYLFFNFRIKDDVFTDNDYYLSRSETLVTFWDQAITSWRKGVVFRLDNPEDI